MILFGNRIAVKIIETSHRSGKIIVPKKKTLEAEVCVLGDKVKFPFKIGDRVIYDINGGSLVTMEGIEYLVLKENEILGVIDDPCK